MLIMQFSSHATSCLVSPGVLSSAFSNTLCLCLFGSGEANCSCTVSPEECSDTLAADMKCELAKLRDDNEMR